MSLVVGVLQHLYDRFVVALAYWMMEERVLVHADLLRVMPRQPSPGRDAKMRGERCPPASVGGVSLDVGTRGWWRRVRRLGGVRRRSSSAAWALYDRSRAL